MLYFNIWFSKNKTGLAKERECIKSMKKMVSMIRWNVILVLCIGVILMGACADDKQENKVEKSFSNADSNT